MNLLTIRRISMVLLVSYQSLNAQTELNAAKKIDSLSQKMETIQNEIRDIRQSTEELEEIVLEKLNIQILIADNSLLRKGKSDLEKENTDLKKWKVDKQQEINLLNSDVSRYQARNDTLHKQLMREEEAYDKILERSIANLIQTGTTANKEFAHNLRKLANENQYVNTAELENFIVALGSLEGLLADFIRFTGREDIENKSVDLYNVVFPFPGLREELNFILYRVRGYCECEQKLSLAIEVAKTQSNEENRQKQLRRRSYEFTYYPSLKAELDKLIEDRNYVFQPKCSN
ncbi:MAG: hypothetical protein ACO3AF_08545 [Flavobacteriales bacterium]